MSGFIVTWDVNSSHCRTAARVRRFIFGSVAERNERIYRYPGFVEKEGVRYLGQSVLFVVPPQLSEIDSFLSGAGVDHEVVPASVG